MTKRFIGLINPALIMLTFALSAKANSQELFKFERLGGYHTRRPAFLTIENEGEKKNLIISSFDVPKPGSGDNFLNYINNLTNASNDTVRVIEGMDSFLKQGPNQWLETSDDKTLETKSFKFKESSSPLEKCVAKGKIDWPNKTEEVPTSVAGEKILAVASGFLTPMRGNGNIYLINSNNRSPLEKGRCASNPSHYIKLMDVPLKPSKGIKTWFHKVIWVDMNDDGLLDAVTAYAESKSGLAPVVSDYEERTGLKKPIFGGSSLTGKGFLVWLEQPKDPSWKEPLLTGKGKQVVWKKHLISEGPDVNFLFEDINNDGQKEFIATEFFGDDNEGALSVIYKENGKYQRRLVDTSVGHGFDLSVADLNNDGNKDILMTNHQPAIGASLKNKVSGRVYAFEVPQNLSTGTFKRHILLDNIPVNKKEMMQDTEMSPGKAIAFYPELAVKDNKPTIFVGGDGASEVYILTPKSQDTDSWEYDSTSLYKQYGFDNKKIMSVTGEAVIDDLNGDGFVEIVIPWYEANYLDIWSISAL